MDVLFQGELHRASQTQPVTAISRFIALWNHRGRLSVKLILYFHVTPLMCLSAHWMIFCLSHSCTNVIQPKGPSSCSLSLPLRPLRFILAITLKKKYHAGPSIYADCLFSLPVHHSSLDLGWWVSAWPNKTNKQSLGMTHLHIPLPLFTWVLHSLKKWVSKRKSMP